VRPPSLPTSRFVDHVAFDCSLSVDRDVKRDMITGTREP
jgi:hypothetical protein